MRALGNSEVETPAIDGLMARRCTFTHCFHQGSWPGAVCKEVETTPLWGQTFGEAGYDTHLVGKWHLSRAALERSFLGTGAVSPGMFESGPDAYNRPRAGDDWTTWDTSRKGQWLHTGQWANAKVDEIRHSAAVWADGAIAYLQTVAQSSKPFFLYVGFNRRTIRGRLRANSSSGIRDEMLAPFPRTRDAVRLHRQEYYAHSTYMDAQIARILEALDRSGKAANTYVISTADHGLAVGEHGLMGKQNLYEHSVRMPYVIAGPGIARRLRRFQRELADDFCDPV